MKTFNELFLERKYWGESASGGIIIAKNTKRILFLLRSGDEDSEQGQWEMTIGGKKDEEDLDAASTFAREAFEEIGLTPDMIKEDGMIEIFYDTGDDHRPFKYHVFFVYTQKEFTPILSDEHSDYMWVDINETIPEPTHFGAERLLKSQKVLDLIK